jgi:glycosyltransferase involved in cell wall biosynthesis
VRISAVFCIYNEEEYLTYSVRSVLPLADRVIICLGLAPYTAYNPKAREISRADRTESVVEELARNNPRIKVIKGIWASEVDHRNTGLRECLENGSDYYWLVDGDEVYREDHLENIRQELNSHPEVGTFIIKCHIFWRSFAYRILAQENPWRPRRIFKMTPFRWILGVKFPYRFRFTGQNETNSMGPVYEITPEQAVFYHFSYARSARAMEDKLRTFSHAHQIKEGWFVNVWERWPVDRNMTNVHPIDPPKFPRVAFFPPDDLPALMRTHPYYGLELIP